MSQSLSNILVHLIFSTKHRQPLLADAESRAKLHAYMMGILNNLECPCLAIGGISDHVHILFVLSKKTSLARVVEEVKRSSSKWIKAEEPALADFYWQTGYAAFSVSASKRDEVWSYVRNQEQHHRAVSFQDELRAFFKRHGVNFDERYVWD
jgi:putative transposase